MEKVWNLISLITSLFIENITTFMSKNYLIIELICIGIILIMFIIILFRHFAHKKMRSQNKLLTSEIASRDNLLANKEEQLEKLKIYNNNLLKEIEINSANYQSDIDAKNAELALITGNYEKSIFEKECKISELETEYERIRVDMDNLIVTKDELDNEHLEILDKNTELNRTVLAFSEKYEDLEKKYNSLLIENDFLKNYETENTVLIKTLRRLKEDEENDVAKTKDAIVALENRLNKKIDVIFNAMSAKNNYASTKLKNLDADLSSLKRTELSKIAKKCGIKNFATWSNEKLIKEIKKYKV